MEHSKKKSPPLQSSPIKWPDMEEHERRDALRELNKKQSDKTYIVRESNENFHGLYEVSSFDKLQPLADVAQTSTHQSQVLVRESYQSMHDMVLSSENQLTSEPFIESWNSEEDSGLCHLVRVLSSHPSEYSSQMDWSNFNRLDKPLFKKSHPHGKQEQKDFSIVSNLPKNSNSTTSPSKKSRTKPQIQLTDSTLTFEDPFLESKITHQSKELLFPKVPVPFVEYHLLPKPSCKDKRDIKDSLGLQTVVEADDSQSKSRRRSSIQSSKDSQVSSALVSSHHHSTFETREEMIARVDDHPKVIFEDVCSDIHGFFGNIDRNLKQLVKKCNYYKRQCSKSKEKNKKIGEASRLSTAISDREKVEKSLGIEVNVWKLMSPSTPSQSTQMGLVSPQGSTKNGEKQGLFFKKTFTKAKKEIQKTAPSLHSGETVIKACSLLSTPKNFNPLDFSKKNGAIRLIAKQSQEATGETPKSIMKLLEKSGILKNKEGHSKLNLKHDRRQSVCLEKQATKNEIPSKAKLSRSTGHRKASTTSSNTSQSRLRLDGMNGTLSSMKDSKPSSRPSSNCKTRNSAKKTKTTKDPISTPNRAQQPLSEAALRTKQLEKAIQHLKRANADGKASSKSCLKKYEEQSQSKSRERKHKLEASVATFLQTFTDTTEVSAKTEGKTKPKSHIRLKTLE
jgi:hypothetical protein